MRQLVWSTAIAATVSGVAAADVVQIEVSGEDGLSLQTFSITFEYDRTVAPSFPGNFAAATLLDVQLGGSAVSFIPTFGAQQVSIVGPVSDDTYAANWENLDGVLAVFFIDPVGGILSTPEELPTATQLQQLLASGSAFASFVNFTTGQEIFAELDSIKVHSVVVPLPPAAWAGLVGLGLVAGSRRLRRNT